MSDYVAKRDPKRCPTHPGIALSDVLDSVHVPKTVIAAVLSISRNHLYGLLRGEKPLSPSIAARVAKLVGGSTESWLRMQASFDAWHANREVDVSGIEPLKVA